MPTRVISLRISVEVDTALRAAAIANPNSDVPTMLWWLLWNSFAGCDLLGRLQDGRGPWNSKLDVRIPRETFDELQTVCDRMGVSISVYARRLLYHVYVTKRLYYERLSGNSYVLRAR
jgi:hypothetical protein